jgi:hypothetical protein
MRAVALLANRKFYFGFVPEEPLELLVPELLLSAPLLLVSEDLWCFLCFLPLVWLVSVELWLDWVPVGDDIPDVPASCPPFDVDPCIPLLLEPEPVP